MVMNPYAVRLFKKKPIETFKKMALKIVGDLVNNDDFSKVIKTEDVAIGFELENF